MTDLAYTEVPYTVSSSYLPAIINDDWTGLDENEVVELTTFLDRNAPQGCYAWCVKAIDNEPELATCEISGLYGECEKVILLVKVNG